MTLCVVVASAIIELIIVVMTNIMYIYKVNSKKILESSV